MRLKLLLAAVAAASFLLAGPARAQSAEDYHPLMSDRFDLSLGVFWPEKTLKIQVDGSAPEEEIDFGQVLDLDDRETTGSLNFRWRFGEKWSLWGQYWDISSGGGAVLDEDIEWKDVVFQEGTFASGGVDVSVGRLFFGRIFSGSLKHEFGLGAGLHWLELSAFLEGQILTSEGDLVFNRQSVDSDFPLPNIGGWYMYSWSRQWALVGRVDWLSASIGDYSGGLWNAHAGINWAPWRHFGFGLYYQYFNLDVDIDKTDWRGAAEATNHGPYLALTGTW